MPIRDENEYYQRRHQQERELAERAANAKARNAHDQLAAEYTKRGVVEAK